MIGAWVLRRAPWLLVGLTLALLLPGTASLPIVDRDEPRFATATREMIERADWVVPTFNGNYRFDKPVLTYWLMRAGYGVFGVGEFGARVHAVIAALALVLVTWWTGRRWFGEKEGFLAAVMLASCLQVFIHGRLALADMPMIACVTISCVALIELLETPSPKAFRNRWWWLLYLSLGVGFLAKGPIVAAVPVLGVLLYRFVFWRKPLPWHCLGLFPGLGLSLAIVASWGIPALLATRGLFWDVGMGEHVVQRGFERFNSRGYSPFFYLGTAPLSLFPWIVFVGLLPWVIRSTWGSRTAWLACWLIAPYIIFTAYATQLPHYVLPAFPALFLLLARGLAVPRETWPRWTLLLARALLWLFAAVFTTALVAVQLAELPEEALPLRGAFSGALLVMIGLLAGAVAMVLWSAAAVPKRRTVTVGAFSLGGLGLVVAGGFLMGGGLRTTSITAHLLEKLPPLHEETRFYGAGFSEPSLVFYTGRRWSFPQTAEELAVALESPRSMIVLTVDEECDPLKLFVEGVKQRFGRTTKPVFKPGSREMNEVARRLDQSGEWSTTQIAGFNLGRTRWQHVRIRVRAP